jgi:dolichol-phosphate mannosyltransferase
MQTLVVLPSYNERDNIWLLIEALLGVDSELSVCVVDDSSPDGTSALVEKAIRDHQEARGRVHLIARGKKDGRGGAVREGFAWGVNSNRGFHAFVEMDCDFSHLPSAVPEGLALLRGGADVVIGARYPDGTIIGWPPYRRIFSFCANMLARVLIDRSVADYTNGFRFYSAPAVRFLLTQSQSHRGYIYLSESLSQLLNAGFTVASFPIVFKNRERGVSNTTISEVLSALKGIVTISLRHHFPGRRRSHSDASSV